MNETQPEPRPRVSGGMDAASWVMMCHLLGLSGYVVPFGNILGPLIVWLVKRDEIPALNDQGKEAVNFQISFMIYLIVAAISIAVFVGAILTPAVIIAQVVFTILAAVKSYQGELYRYPLTIKFIK